MATTLTNQLERLSYTRRDIELIDAEVDRFLESFIPTIRDSGKANVGRLFLRVVEALIDKLNYSLDLRFRQSVLRTVTELQAAIDITELVRYTPPGVEAATADLTATILVGVAGAGGVAIPQFSTFASETSPVRPFLSLEAATIPEGGTTTTIQVVQGIRSVVDVVIKSSASGEANEEIIFPTAKTPFQYITIKVDGDTYTPQSDLKDSEATDLHYFLKVDEDLFTRVTFGDGLFGAKLTPGAPVTATFIASDGEDSNVGRDKITVVVGGLSSTISVTNPEVASGGTNGDDVDDIKRKAPLQASAFFTASNDRTYEALAESLVSGVFQVLVDQSDSPIIDMFVMPDGGGVASSALLQSIKDILAPREIHGAFLNTFALNSAHILIKMRVILLSRTANKTVARQKVVDTISATNPDGSDNTTGALYFKNLIVGKGFAQSDISALLENIDNGDLVDFVDFLTFTRYPTVIASNPAAPKFQGEIQPNSIASYDDWSISVLTTTTFRLFKNAVIDSSGTIGVPLTSSDGSITFTLGKTTDLFTLGDIWTFKTSAFKDTMRLDDIEFMELVRDSDLDITIFFPDEFIVGIT